MGQAPPNIRVTIYDRTGTNVLALDASGDIGRGRLTYSDGPDGCAAATIPVMRYYEDIFALGYWTGLNIVEISSGDNTLQTSINATTAGGTAKLYLDTNWGFDPSIWYDSQLAYLWDGVNLTMRCPVESIGSDGGGPYIVIGTPLGGGGIPAYNAMQTTVGRRRYAGRIVRRQRINQKTPDATITCQGLKDALSGTNGSFVINQAANQDIATALYSALNLFATQLPFLTISSGNFPTLGQTYSGTYHDTDVQSFLSDVLKTITSNDGWHVRIGHDRTPRLVKLYTASSDTYSVNVTVNQTIPTQAFTVSVVDEDTSNLYNRIKVIGDVDPTTKLPVSAIVDDSSSIAIYGLTIDGSPVQVQGLKTNSDCEDYAQALLDANSLAQSVQKLVVYTRRNDVANIALPGGMKSGDVLPPVANIIATGFTGQKNLVPDSEFNYFPGGLTPAIWTENIGDNPFTVVPGGPGGSNMVQYLGTGSRANGYFFGGVIPVIPGQTYTISGYIAAQSVTGSVGGAGASWRVFNYPTPTVAYATATQAPGVNSRISATFTVPPGVTQVMVLGDTFGAVVTNTQGLWWSRPQLELSPIKTAYQQSSLTPTPPDINGLANVITTSVDCASTDVWQDAQFSGMMPPWSAAIAEQANATATALVSNTLTRAGVDQYFVDQSAYPFTVSPISLTVSVPSFPAVFAAGSMPVSCGGNSFTLSANSTTWVWLEQNGSWNLQSNSNPVSGAIPYGYFWTNGSGVIGSDELASIGLLNIPMSYLLNGVAYTPTFSSNSITQAVTGPLVSQINVSFSVTNQPTDGSFSKILFWYRQHGQPDWLLLGSDVPRNSSGSPQAAPGPFYATGAYAANFPDASNGVEYDFGFSLESGASSETAVISLGNITPSSNSTPGSSGLTLPASALPPYATNLLSDSNFQNSPFNSSGIAALSSYWIFQLIDGASFSVKKGSAADGSNYLCWTSGASGSNRYGYSQPVAVATGQTYVLSAYFDARNVTGSNLPFVAIYDYSSGSLGAQLAHVTQAAGAHGRIQTYWTATSGVTAVVLMLSNGSATINSSTSGGAPGFLVGATPQLELSATSPGYASTYQPTNGVNTDGTQAHAAMSAPVQLRVSQSAALNVSTTPGAVVGALPQANHDPAVLLSSVTGVQKNLVPDSGFTFGSGGSTNYFAKGVYWDVGSSSSPNALIVFNGIGNGSNAVDFTNPNTSANSQFVNGTSFYCAAGTYTMSCVIANNQNSGNLIAAVLTFGTAANVGQITQAPSTNGRVSAQITIPTAGQYYFFFTMNGSSGASGAQSFFCNPQLEAGSVMTAYQQTGTPDIAGTIAHGAMSPATQEAISSGGLVVGIGATLVSTGGALETDILGGVTPTPYTMNTAAVIDLTALPASQSFFVLYTLQMGFSFAGSLPMQMRGVHNAGTVSNEMTSGSDYVPGQSFPPPLTGSFVASGGQSISIKVTVSGATSIGAGGSSIQCETINVLATRVT